MVQYIIIAAAAAVSLLIAFGLGYIVIPWLHKLNFGQTILDIGPNWHKNKEGTPIMGGIMFIVSTLVTFGIAAGAYRLVTGDSFISSDAITASRTFVKIFGGIVMALGFALIGFADDYIKAVKKRNLGLTVKQKTFLQVLVSIGYLGSLYAAGCDYMFIPFFGNVNMGIFFWFFGIFVIYCTTNAVNFTDGVDGLCGSVTAAAAAAMAVIAILRGYAGVSLLSASLAGGCVGYFIWNRYPCKVMMGDTGSMFLGGMIVALTYAVDCPLLILPVGIIYVIEFMSDIIQITYFKATHGKRLFKMAPIHHHFEKCGWKETKIVKVFTAIGIIGGIIGILTVYFGNPK